MNLLKTSCSNNISRCPAFRQTLTAYLNGPDVRVLGGVLVLVQTVLRRLSFPEIHGQLDKLYHHRLEGGDRVVAGALGDDMLVQEGQRGLLLADANELLGALHRDDMLAESDAGGQRVGGGRGDARRFGAQSAQKALALSTFSGRLWGGGGMMGKLCRYERLAGACCVGSRSRAARASLGAGKIVC